MNVTFELPSGLDVWENLTEPPVPQIKRLFKVALHWKDERPISFKAVAVSCGTIVSAKCLDESSS